MKYAVCTPLAVFCCEVNLNSLQLINWLDIGSAVYQGVYENAHRIHHLLQQRTGGVWVVDNMFDTLPDGQTPREYADFIIPADKLGF